MRDRTESPWVLENMRDESERAFVGCVVEAGRQRQFLYSPFVPGGINSALASEMGPPGGRFPLLSKTGFESPKDGQFNLDDSPENRISIRERIHPKNNAKTLWN